MFEVVKNKLGLTIIEYGLVAAAISILMLGIGMLNF